MKAIQDVLAPDTAKDQGVEKTVDGVGHGVGLCLAGIAADGAGHGPGLIDEEEKAGRVGPADLRGVRHGCGLIRVASALARRRKSFDYTRPGASPARE